MQTEQRRLELWSACQRGDIEALEELFAKHRIQASRILNQTGECGNANALMRAASHGHAHIVRWLLGHGAMLNQQGIAGSTALHYAVQERQPQVVVELLRWGADPHIPDERNITALQEAQQQDDKCCLQVVEAIIASSRPWTPDSHHVHLQRTRSLAATICKLSYAIDREYDVPRALWMAYVDPFLRLEPGAKVA